MLVETIEKDLRFVAIYNARKMAAGNARAAQAKYRQSAFMFVFSTTMAAVAEGFMMYGLYSENAQGPIIKSVVSKKEVQIVLTFIQALSQAAAAYFGFLQHRSRFDEIWVYNRISAENGRLEGATAALEIGHEQGAEARTLLFELASR